MNVAVVHARVNLFICIHFSFAVYLLLMSMHETFHMRRAPLNSRHGIAKVQLQHVVLDGSETFLHAPCQKV